MPSITKKLELMVWGDDLQNPDKVTDFARRNTCLGITTIPETFLMFLTSKLKGNAISKLGVMIDYPTGRSTGMHKFTLLPEEYGDIDFYEFMYRESTLASDYQKEIKLSVDIVRSLNSTAGIRVGIDPKRPEAMNRALLEAVSKLPVQRINVGISPLSSYDHEAMINMVREYTSLPIKVTGSITSENVDKISEMTNDIIFGVSYGQALALLEAEKIKELVKANHRLAMKQGNLETQSEETK